jgi:hypothetical protein
LKQENDAGKENEPLVNSFHQALLQAKNNDTRGPHEPPRHQTNAKLAEKPSAKTVKPKKQEKQIAVSTVEDAEMQGDGQAVEKILYSPPPPDSAKPIMEEVIVNSLASPRAEQVNDLSAIAEDDESADRSVQTTAKPVVPVIGAKIYLNDLVTQETEPSNVSITDQAPMEIDDDDTIQTGNITTSSSQTFHSIPLDSPKTLEPQPSTQNSSNTNSEYLTAPLRQIPYSGPSVNEATTAPLAITSSALTPSTMSEPIKEAPVQFPSLPAPSPLRKSMRVPREPSFGVGMGPVPPLPTVTVAAGKRTSWLMKAREVKAMEVPGKQASALGAVAFAAPVPGMSSGSKRKSGDMVATTIPGMAGTALAEDERKRKIMKTSEGDIAVSAEKSKNIGKELVPRPSQLPPTIQPEPTHISFPTGSSEESIKLMSFQVPQEGMMDRLKRTVEGLGARTGKGMSKSLGGAAAAAALAEVKAAKVAAEARIAERDGRSVVPSRTPDLMVGVEQSISVVPATSMDEIRTGPALPPTAGERKLSISDLLTAYEDGGKGKFREKTKEIEKGFKPVRASASNENYIGDENTSTTPPVSPPSTRTSNSSFVLPSGPVFNKPPVFVPPAYAVAASFNPPSTAFFLPPASSLGVPAHLPSPSSLKSAPALSAQSTAVSLYSDAVFDSQNDVSAWMPDTQDTEYSVGQIQSQPSQKIDDLDEDDSWPMVDEKLAAANPSWTPFGFTKEDSMTWSTLPTESQRDTRSTQNRTNQSADLRADSSAKNVSGLSGMEVDGPNVDTLEDDDLDLRESELEDLALEAGKSSVSLVKVCSFLGWSFIIFKYFLVVSRKIQREAKVKCLWCQLPLRSHRSAG